MFLPIIMRVSNHSHYYRISRGRSMDKALGLTNTQKKIIDAAIKVFSEKGFEGATTSEIAQEAGVAEGTIFRHFSTKKRDTSGYPSASG
jgi:AcrR family transcriptional regulator